MPTFMLVIGGLIGAAIGLILGGGMAALGGLPVYGPVTNVFVALISLGPSAIHSQVLDPIAALFGAGLGLLTATIFFYAAAALSTALGVVLSERFARGLMIGASAGANLIIMSAIAWLPIGFAPIVATILFLAVIPPIAANRFYQRVIGAVGWVLPMNYLMLPLGVLLFLVTAPISLFAPMSAVRWDWLTWTVETSGGLLAPLASFTGGFNIGNFTFIPAAPSAFTAGVSAHETGHTLSGAAFGGFFYWIGAVDENVPPLRRGAFAYSEMMADGHFGGVGGPSITMW